VRRGILRGIRVSGPERRATEPDKSVTLWTAILATSLFHPVPRRCTLDPILKGAIAAPNGGKVRVQIADSGGSTMQRASLRQTVLQNFDPTKEQKHRNSRYEKITPEELFERCVWKIQDRGNQGAPAASLKSLAHSLHGP
jgi:hypothetical protein